MTRTIGAGAEALRAAMTGAVLIDGDAGYDDARLVWNGDFDRRPAVLARCESAEDVAAALAYAQAEGAVGCAQPVVPDRPSDLVVDPAGGNRIDAVEPGSRHRGLRC